jgi:hypothetical protein
MGAITWGFPQRSELFQPQPDNLNFITSRSNYYYSEIVLAKLSLKFSYSVQCFLIYSLMVSSRHMYTLILPTIRLLSSFAFFFFLTRLVPGS